MTRPLRSLSSGLLGFGARITGVGAGLAALTAGLTGVAVVASSVKKAMDFESQLSSIQALTGASNEEMAKMQALALKMGAVTKYNALEAAQAIEELLKAGLTPATVQAGGLEAALNLATAGGLELTEAAETMATSLNAFKKDGLTAAQTSDILAGTANAAATDVRALGFALASAGGVADMYGVSFSDFNAAIGLMSNDGLKNGSDAGTSFKSMLMYLNPTTKDSIKLFNKLGLGVGKASKFFKDGKIKSLAEVSQVLHDSLKDMTDQNRTTTLLDMFGTDGVKAATSLYKAGAAGVKDFQKEMMNVTALDVAKKKMDNAAGAVEQFKGAIETLQISALLPVMPIIKDFALAAAGAVEKYMPQITASMQKSMEKLRAFLNTNYLENDDFLALNFADKVKVVAADIKNVFDTWWASSGQAQFTAVSENITKTLLASLENSVPTLTKIGLDLGVGLMSGIVDGMRQSKSLGWVFEGIDIFTPGYVKDAWKSIGIDVGTKDNVTSKVNGSTGAASRALSTGQTPPSFGPDTAGFLNSLPKKSGGLNRVPGTMPVMVHKDEAILHRGEARQWRNGGNSGGVTVTGNTFNVRKESDINDIAMQLYRLIDGGGVAY